MIGRIIIGGDIAPTLLNRELFIKGDTSALIGEKLMEIFRRADKRVFNLEIPFADEETPIFKSGPNLIAPTASVNGYAQMGIDALSVANNHTLDQGKSAFVRTLEILRENGITPFGGGVSEAEVKRPYIMEVAGKRIGVVSFCEHEFSWFDDYGVGARGFDPLVSLDEISKHKMDVDYLVVMYHGGREHYRYPSPMLRKVCRAIAEHGADLILCQHSHCVGAGEVWNGCEIVYGQGNALFAYEKRSDPCWFTGMISEIVIADGEFSVTHYPIERYECGVRLSDDPEILDGYKRRSEECKIPGFVEARYDELIDSYSADIERHLSRFANALSKEDISGAVARNLINCDPHRELLIGYLNKYHKMNR